MPSAARLDPRRLILATLALAGPALGASEPPARHPALSGPSIEERILQMDAPPPNREPVRPDGSASGAGAAFREGSFLVSRRGRLQQRADGWWFHFDADAAGKADAPVAVHPSATLAGMLRLMESRREPTTFFLSAEVFAFDGRNYILPTHFTVAATTTHQPLPEPVEPAQPEADGGADPSAASLIRGVDRATARRREAPVATSAAAPAGPVVAEGEFFNLRRARGMPDQNGGWRVAFDNGTGDAGADAPMALLPCRTLGRMIALARSTREGLTVTVSGRVFLFEGRNYLLPTLFFVDYASAVGEIRSAQ
ncbi:MAG: hypothetical protein IBJ10_00885 [Phycisphaerales bacterium]|nr:hypothetical protein [Phycisphaerales bacterium]